MRLAIGIVAALAQPAIAQPADSNALVLEGATRAAQRDHLGAIDLYRRAYAIDGDVALLPIIAVEYRRAGRPLDAVQYFCSYLYTTPGGPAADDATAQVRAIETDLGYPSEPEHHVCTPVDWAPFGAHPPALTAATAPAPPPPPPPPAISTREMAGAAIGLGGGILLGVAAYYGVQAQHISNAIETHDATIPWSSNIIALEQRGQSDEARERAFAIVGGAALATGVVLYVTGRAARVAEHVTVAPTAAGGGISVHGRW